MKNKTFINKLTCNWGLKLIALVVAFLIWLLVTNTNNPIGSDLFTGVPINMVNQDSVADIGKVARLEGSGTVTLKVTERRRVREQLSRSDFRYRSWKGQFCGGSQPESASGRTAERSGGGSGESDRDEYGASDSDLHQLCRDLG